MPDTGAQDLTGLSVVISGSRDWTNSTVVVEILRKIKSAGAKEVLVGYDPDKQVPKGVDEICYFACKELGIDTRTFKPTWIVNGKVNRGAGLIRNSQMLAQAHWAVCFWTGSEGSRGTPDMIVKAHQRGKLFRIYGPPGMRSTQNELLAQAYKVRKVKFITEVASGNAE